MKHKPRSAVAANRLRVGKKFNPFRLFNGIWIPDALLSFEDISPGAKLLYGLLGRYAGKDGKCYPSQETIAQKLNRQQRQIRNLLGELERTKLIRWVRRGPGMSNWYEFLLHPDLMASIREEHRQNIAVTRPAEPCRLDRRNIAAKESSLKESHREESQHANQVDVLKRSASRAIRRQVPSSKGQEKDKLPRFERAMRASDLPPQSAAAPLQWGALQSEKPTVAKIQDALFRAFKDHLGYPIPKSLKAFC